ncbi:MAG: ribosome silencing factor [Candidatus Hydrothermales bacterium]
MEIVKYISEIIYNKKGEDILIIDVRNLLKGICDYFILATSLSEDHARAIADEIESKLKKRGIKIHHIEGYENGKWVLVDAGDVIIHIFDEKTRAFYDLESLYENSRKIKYDTTLRD